MVKVRRKWLRVQRRHAVIGSPSVSAWLKYIEIEEARVDARGFFEWVLIPRKVGGPEAMAIAVSEAMVQGELISDKSEDIRVHVFDGAWKVFGSEFCYLTMDAAGKRLGAQGVPVTTCRPLARAAAPKESFLAYQNFIESVEA
jgi:hypothetical protein